MAREALPADASLETIVDLDWNFFNAVVSASHNPLLLNLNAIIRVPFRTTLLYTFRTETTVALALRAHRDLFKARAVRIPSQRARPQSER
jgi:DNA-binding FadR family transcriptional regulator